MSALVALMREDLAAPAPDGLQPLLKALERRFGKALLGVVLYGSCRRQQRLNEGLVDLLVFVSGYRAAYGFGLSALLNRLLPPNVYYLEVEAGETRLRTKYAVVTPTQFLRRCRAPIDLYFWARFAQPCRLVLARGEPLAENVAQARATAARTLARRIAPLLPGEPDPLRFWSFALATTYRCELRPEAPTAAQRLIKADPEFWTRLSGALAEFDAELRASGIFSRLATRAGWTLRRVTGKLYNLARLFKAAGTFSNGIDYIVWKVERHSGVRVEPTERMRRHPRLAAWGLAWRMWRHGGFR